MRNPGQVSILRRRPSVYSYSELSISTYRTVLLLPSITRRIDDFLIVKELNAQLFGNMILEQHLLSAIFAPSATFETDYERLELFGEVRLMLMGLMLILQCKAIPS